MILHRISFQTQYSVSVGNFFEVRFQLIMLWKGLNIKFIYFKDALLRLTWKHTFEHTFFESFQSLTDYGACGVIFPNLDFNNSIDNELKDRQYNGSVLSNVTYGVRNGLKNGLEIFADVEIFDYAYFVHGATGFVISFAHNSDKAIINQKGFYVGPGAENLISMTAKMITARLNPFCP